MLAGIFGFLILKIWTRQKICITYIRIGKKAKNRTY